MKINRRTGTKKKIIIAATLVIAVSAGAFYYVWKTDNVGVQSGGETKGIDYSSPTDDQIRTGEEAKKATVDADAKQSSSSNRAPSPAPDQQKKQVTVTITSPDTESGATLSIRTDINTLTNSGTCTLTLTKPGSQTITKTADVQAFASSSTCKGFDLPTSGLERGTWTATITFDNTTLNGSTTKTITIQ